MSSLRTQVEQLVEQGHRAHEIKAAVPGLSSSTIDQYVRRYRTTLSQERRDEIDELRRLRPTRARSAYQQPFTERAPVSTIARRIGFLLSRFRDSQGLNCAEFARTYSFANQSRLAAMEAGLIDFSITEIERISEITGHTVEHLISISKKQQDFYSKADPSGKE